MDSARHQRNRWMRRTGSICFLQRIGWPSSGRAPREWESDLRQSSRRTSGYAGRSARSSRPTRCQGRSSKAALLSKVYGLIAGFSDDVDIVLDHHALSFEGDKDPSTFTNQRKRHLEELATACSQTVQGLVRENLQKRFHSELGDAGWSITPDFADPDGQSLLFAYPVGLESRLYGTVGYIRPVVRLEFGCRGDVWPNGERTIRAESRTRTGGGPCKG